MKSEYLYRINGFDQIKAFYSWLFNNQDKEINTSHVSLYLFLINQNNRSNWVEWFKCPYDLGMAGSCIGSRNTYYKCLKDLKEWNLIDYQKGKNNYKAPLIKLCLFKNEQLIEQVPVPLSEPLTEHLPIPLTEPLTEHIYKLLTNNLKRITDNLPSVIKFLDELESVKIINPEMEELYNSVVIFFDENCRPKTESQKSEWIDTLDKLVRIDGHTPEEIQNVIKRARMDDFWRQNFLSILKLRKKNKENIPYYTVFEKKLNYGAKKTIGADPVELANLVAGKIGVGE